MGFGFVTKGWGELSGAVKVETRVAVCIENFSSRYRWRGLASCRIILPAEEHLKESNGT